MLKAQIESPFAPLVVGVLRSARFNLIADLGMVDRRIYHLHIPKTAGTSFRIWLSDLFDQQACCPWFHHHELDARNNQSLHRYCFFSGHHGYPLVERLGAIFPLATVTFLREPVRREYSEWNYIRNFTDEQIRRFGKETWARADLVQAAQTLSPSKFLTSSAKSQNANTQVKHLLGTPDSTAPAPEKIAFAMQRLLDLDAFGLVEDMERSALMINAELGLPPRLLSKHFNVRDDASHPMADWNDSDIALASETNNLDIQLYAFAKNEFERRWQGLLKQKGVEPGPGEIDRLRETLLRFTPTISVNPIKAGFLGVESGMLLDGWHERFFYPPLGRWLRWAGPGLTSLMWLPLDRSEPRHIQIEIAYFMSHHISNALEISVAQTNFTACHDDDANDSLSVGRRFSTTLPPLTDNSQYTLIKFKVPEVLSTPEGNSQSFALSGITIF